MADSLEASDVRRIIARARAVATREGEGLTLYISLDGSRAWFEKQVWDPASGELQVIERWERMSWQLDPVRRSIDLLDIDLGDEQGYARDLMRAYVDAFLLEYLRVNEDYFS